MASLSIDCSLAGDSFTLALPAAGCKPTAHTGDAHLDCFGLLGMVAPRWKSA